MKILGLVLLSSVVFAADPICVRHYKDPVPCQISPESYHYVHGMKDASEKVCTRKYDDFYCGQAKEYEKVTDTAGNLICVLNNNQPPVANLCESTPQFYSYIRVAAPTDEDYERDFHPDYLARATGVLRSPLRYDWPVSFLSIGHTIGSYQDYGAGAYFHHGLDIRADAGSDVRVVAGGKVVNIQNYVPGSPAYWEIAILDDAGFIWQYHHVNRQSIPEAVFTAFHDGGSVEAGDKLGEVYYWSEVTFGERYHHIHLNVLGDGKRYLNGFAFLEPLHDTQTPWVEEIGILQNGAKKPGNTVKGSYSLYAHVGDLILHEKFIVPPHSIVAAVDGEEPFTVWAFDDLPGGSSNTDFVKDLYVRSLTCGDYSCRKPVVDLGFETSRRRSFPSGAGSHSVTVVVRDFAGNESSKVFDWTVQ